MEEIRFLVQGSAKEPYRVTFRKTAQPCRLLHLSGWGEWSALQTSYEHSSWNYFRNRKWQRSKGTSCHFMAPWY